MCYEGRMYFGGASFARETILEYGTEPEWVRADRALRSLAKERAMHDFQEAGCIRDAARARVHQKLGFASFTEYLNRLFGYGPRLANEKVRVELAIEGLPELAIALRDGVLNWSAIRVLSLVVT